MGKQTPSPLSLCDIPPFGGNLICVEVFYSPAQRKTEYVRIEIKEGTPLAEAIPAPLAAMVASEGLTSAVWGRAVPQDYKLQAGDRIELVRGLRVDPMTARRERFNKQGIKTAGLFKTKRQGAKQGY
jgi:putative ubiquitin-RnfH superfamily antitoxin RatB of RatAB toxin-antitoxin module